MSEKKDIPAEETVATREQGVLKFWEENKIFGKSESGISGGGFFNTIIKK